MDGAQGRHGRGPIDQHADLDLAGRDHLDVDARRGQGLEHRGGHAGVGAHAQADDRDLGDLGVVGDARWRRSPRAAASAARSVSGRSPLATVKLTSVVPSVDTFWTIMSTTMFAARDRAEDRVDDARPVGHAEDRDPGLVLDQRRAGHRRRPAGGRRRSPTIQVPGASENELRTWIGTPYFLANSIERECITPAPRLASSSISS